MKYIIRLDDITEGTNWFYFEKLEKVFDKYDIKPILGIVPFNKDKSIINNDFIIDRDEFIKKLKQFNEKKYIIAMHGFNHVLKKTSKKSIIRINNYGEFTNDNKELKCVKLKKGKLFFEKNNIKIDMYMPPAHWIDKETIECLIELDFKYITDGLFAYPVKKGNIFFIPQQLWKPRKIPFPGIYTICLHINEYKDSDIEIIISFIEKNYKSFVNFNSLKESLTDFDKIYYKIYNYFYERFLFFYLKSKKIRSN